MGHSESKAQHYNKQQQEEFFEQVDMYVHHDDRNRNYDLSVTKIPSFDARQATFESLPRRDTSNFNEPQKSPFISIRSNSIRELRSCLNFVGSSTTSYLALQVNGCIVGPALQTLNHPYADPDITNWVIMDLNTLSRIPFEKMKHEKRFQIGGSRIHTPRLTEVNLASLVKQYVVDVSHESSEAQLQVVPKQILKNINLSVISSRSKLKDQDIQTERSSEQKNAQSPMHNKFFFLQKNENFTDIDDYLNTIESDVPKQQSDAGSRIFNKELDHKFRHNESIQLIKDSKTTSSRSLSQQMKVNEPTRPITSKKRIDYENSQEVIRKAETQYRSQQIHKDKVKSVTPRVQEIKKSIHQNLKTAQKNSHYDTDEEYPPDKKSQLQPQRQYPGQIQYKPVQAIQVPEKKPTESSRIEVSKTSNVKFYGSLKQQVLQQKEQKDQQPKPKSNQPIKTKSPNTSQMDQYKDAQIKPIYQSSYTDRQQQKVQTSPTYPSQVTKTQTASNNQHQPIPEILTLKDTRKQHQQSVNQRQESLNILQTKIDQILRESSDKKNHPKKQVYPPFQELDEFTNQQQNHTTPRPDDSQQHLKDIKYDIDRLSDKINLTISPSFNTNEREHQKSHQKTKKGQQTTANKYNTQQEQSLNYDNLPDFKEPAIIQFSWEQLQNYKKN